MLRFEAEDRERVLEKSLVQKGDFILKRGVKTPGQKDPASGLEDWLIIYFQVGKG